MAPTPNESAALGPIRMRIEAWTSVDDLLRSMSSFVEWRDEGEDFARGNVDAFTNERFLALQVIIG